MRQKEERIAQIPMYMDIKKTLKRFYCNLKTISQRPEIGEFPRLSRSRFRNAARLANVRFQERADQI